MGAGHGVIIDISTDTPGRINLHVRLAGGHSGDAEMAVAEAHDLRRALAEVISAAERGHHQTQQVEA